MDEIKKYHEIRLSNQKEFDKIVLNKFKKNLFDDEKKIMNKSLIDIDGEILIISQFTLHALTKKGNRPSYIKAAKSELAVNIYNDFLKEISKKLNKTPKAGVFGADMLVKIENDGPVTIFMDSKNKSF